MSASQSCCHSSDEEEDDNYLSVRGAMAELGDSHSISNLSFASSATGLLTPEPHPDITSDMFGQLASSSEQISVCSSASQTNTETANCNKMFLEIPPHHHNCGQVCT